MLTTQFYTGFVAACSPPLHNMHRVVVQKSCSRIQLFLKCVPNIDNITQIAKIIRKYTKTIKELY